MTDHPMLFSAPMVRALLAGTKTQTRRIVKFQGPKGYPHSFEHALVDNPAGVQRLLVPFNHPSEPKLEWGENGYHRHYGPADLGDRVWVKETFSPAMPSGYDRRDDGGDYWFRATDSGAVNGPWRPSIFMPKEASRLTLHVTSTKIERVQDITEGDAEAEGMTQATADAIMDADELALYASTLVLCPGARARILYETIWDQINGDGSWASNPWVFAVTFTVERCNIAIARTA